MKVQQAVFTSAETGRMKGYQLVSRSPEVEPHVAQELCRWSPSHASLVDEAADYWSFNAFPAGQERTAVARTVHGGPEYSNRGGTQIVTLMLMLTREQFAAYHDDALAVGRTALAMGRLRLPPAFPEQLPAAELPERSLFASESEGEALTGGDVQTDLPPVLAEALELLLAGRRVAVVGQGEPVASLQMLMAHIPRPRRREISFTTGLKPSARRQFQLHFLPAVDAALQHSLVSQGIECVGPAPVRS